MSSRQRVCWCPDCPCAGVATRDLPHDVRRRRLACLNERFLAEVDPSKRAARGERGAAASASAARARADRWWPRGASRQSRWGKLRALGRALVLPRGGTAAKVKG
jgi:hypothetical protein